VTSVGRCRVGFRIVEQVLRGSEFAPMCPETPWSFEAGDLALISGEGPGWEPGKPNCNLFVRGTDRKKDGVTSRCGPVQWESICKAVDLYNEEMERHVAVNVSGDVVAEMVRKAVDDEGVVLPSEYHGGKWLRVGLMGRGSGFVRFRIVEQALRGSEFAPMCPETPGSFSVPEAGMTLVSNVRPEWTGSPVQSTLSVRGSNERSDDVTVRCGSAQWERICKAVDLYNEEMERCAGAQLASAGAEAGDPFGDPEGLAPPAASEGVKAPEVVPETSAEDVRLAPGSEEGVAAILRLGGKVVYVAAGAHVTINIG